MLPCAITQPPRRIAQRHHFGMCRGVVAGNRLVESTADDLAAAHHQRPHRHLARVPALACQFQRDAHVVFICHRILFGSKYYVMVT